MFVLEDRVTARTNSGQNEPEGNPNDIPDVDSVVAGIVGSVPPSEWGQNVTDQLLELKVRFCADGRHLHLPKQANTKLNRFYHTRLCQCILDECPGCHM